MTSIVAQPPHFVASSMTQSGNPMDAHRDVAQAQPKIKPDPAERPRGRRRSRTMTRPKENSEYASVGDGDDGQSSEPDGADGPDGPRKRRRSRKGLDKKFECPQDGCGKSYSRAEHL
jgi:hypothetical protein